MCIRLRELSIVKAGGRPQGIAHTKTGGFGVLKECQECGLACADYCGEGRRATGRSPLQSQGIWRFERGPGMWFGLRKLLGLKQADASKGSPIQTPLLWRFGRCSQEGSSFVLLVCDLCHRPGVVPICKCLVYVRTTKHPRNFPGTTPISRMESIVK